MAQRGKDTSDIIWVIVNSEDTQGKANATNAQGCRELCEVRVDAQADMLYEQLSGQANELRQPPADPAPIPCRPETGLLKTRRFPRA